MTTVWPADRLWQMFVWDHECTGFGVLAEVERVVRYLDHTVAVPHLTAVEVGNDFFHLVVSTAPLDEAWGRTYRAALDRRRPDGNADLPTIEVPADYEPDGNRHVILRRFFGPLAALYGAQALEKSPDVFDFRPWMK